MLADYVVLDFETRAAANLKTVGSHKYMECEHFDAMCLGWEWPTGPANIWLRGEPPPQAVFDHIRAGRRVVAHQAEFEIGVFATMNRRFPDIWPRLEPEQVIDTMQLGRNLGLPGGLDAMLAALRLPYSKDAEGYALMLQLCKPRKPKKGERTDIPLWHEEPEQLKRQGVYCIHDVTPTHVLYKTLPLMSAKQHELWCYNVHINERGVAIDLPAVEAGIAAVAQESERLNARFAELTGNAVAKGTERNNILAWLETQGIVMGKLRKSDVQAMLDDPDALANKETVRTVLELRKEAAKAGLAKLKAMQRRACADGRVRGMYNFNAANTSRFGGSGVQTQNLMRPSKGIKPKDAAQIIEWLQKPKGLEAIRLWYGPPMDAIASSLRSFIVAEPGKRFVQTDMSNIEGRMLAWLAGEQWKLDAYRAYDTFKRGPDGKLVLNAKGEPERMGPDLYNVMASGVLQKPLEAVTEDDRQVFGKVPELALGYQGGVGAFMSMGANYGISVVKKREDAPKNAKYVLLESEVDEIKLKWREENPAIAQFWYDALSAAIEAVRRPGAVTKAGRLHYTKTGDFLQCILPSGESIYYPYPELRVMTTTFYEREVWRLKKAIEDAEDEAHTDDGARHLGALMDILQDLLDNPDRREQLTYWGVSSKSKNKSWGLQRAYGGILVENATQAIATGSKGMLGEAMLACKRAGFLLAMHTHDELLRETSDRNFSETDLAQIICAPVEWAHGLPIAAAGWTGPRYRK